MLRPDLLVIASLIPPGSRVLDLGCGRGELLEYLVEEKKVEGRGVEISESGVLECVRRGLSARHGNLDEGLADYPDRSFDYVILSQTLPYLSDPVMILREMLRVGERAVVSFPNWGHWRNRVSFLLTGRIPQALSHPQPWYRAPRMHPMTVRDFGSLCREMGITVERQVYMSGDRVLRRHWRKNLRSTVAIFVLKSGSGSLP